MKKTPEELKQYRIEKKQKEIQDRIEFAKTHLPSDLCNINYNYVYQLYKMSDERLLTEYTKIYLQNRDSIELQVIIFLFYIRGISITNGIISLTISR